MSFASEARGEIAGRAPDGQAAVRAACYGLACFARRFDAEGLLLQTEQAETAQFAGRCFARCGIEGAVRTRQHAAGTVYEFCIEGPGPAAQMHALLGTTGRELSLQIDPALLRGRGSVNAYIAAAFLCCGTVTDPQKGYHLEFTTPRRNLARDLESLLAEHEFGVEDEDVLNAIRYHTSGRAGMSPLEKLIFLADMLEEGRDYDGVERLRALFDEDVDLCLEEALKEQLDYLKRSGKDIYPLTAEAYEFIAGERASRSHDDE